MEKRQEIYRIIIRSYILRLVKVYNLIKGYVLRGIKIGAYGEVRKAIHKKTNITRAVKVISKSKTDSEAQKKLINEVNILKKLVRENDDFES